MYFIEGKTGGFTSITLSIYWAITTLLTAGHVDIMVPQAGIGRSVAPVIRTLHYNNATYCRNS
ncbi:hypothetical protein [Methanosarcina sp.]|uniref:hypothetical protein n=1 Tax=Methanosarcina sp. TaxID=2213 RepID=UPI002ABA7208|nr:hypothetical protein [Methanosarcina sp.]MDY9927308.1 hypothetical protein [Methanosarcina sp.]